MMKLGLERGCAGWFIKKIRRFRHDKTGAAAVLFGLVLLPVMFLLGTAIDYQRAVSAKMALQYAVDAGALAAARQAGSTQAQRTRWAQTEILANLGSKASVLNPSISETEPSSTTYRVSATASLPTVFMKLANVSSMEIAATATASLAASGSTPNVCLLALSKVVAPGFLVNQNASITWPNCEIDVASTGSPAATFNAGDVFNLSKICVAGSSTLQNGGSVAVLQTNCATASDPFAGNLPIPTIGACISGGNYNGSQTFSPGTYCGTFNFNGGGGVATFLPGTYVFSGVSWNMNTGWSMVGTGVTFYFADSSYIQINSGVSATLTAPTSGPYADILMYEAAGLSVSSFTIDGSAGHSFQGLIYLPSRNITFNNMSNLSPEPVTLVVNSAIIDSLNWNLQSAAHVIPAVAGLGAPHLTQ